MLDVSGESRSRNRSHESSTHTCTWHTNLQSRFFRSCAKFAPAPTTDPTSQLYLKETRVNIWSMICTADMETATKTGTERVGDPSVSIVRRVLSHGEAIVKLGRRVLLDACEGVPRVSHDVLRAGRRRARPAVHRRGDSRAPPRGRRGAAASHALVRVSGGGGRHAARHHHGAARRWDLDPVARGHIHRPVEHADAFGRIEARNDLADLVWVRAGVRGGRE